MVEVDNSQLSGGGTFSVVILTWNRHDRLRSALERLASLVGPSVEVLVVDNGSTPPVSDAIAPHFLFARVIRVEENQGTGSRNVGIRAAKGDYIICLDDDVYGLDRAGLEAIHDTFAADRTVGAICFKVLDEADPSKQINWCHDYALETHADERFLTDEISEGAVVFRASAVASLPLFPLEYFISHEGVAVAYQLMNAGHSVVYNPAIAVIHATAQEGRKSWRRYYFDTRNNFWLTAQYFSIGRGLMRLAREVAAMLIYSVRDGFFKYWLKAVFEGVRQLPRVIRNREPPSPNTKSILRQIDRHRPSLLHKLKERLNRKGVEI